MVVNKLYCQLGALINKMQFVSSLCSFVEARYLVYRSTVVTWLACDNNESSAMHRVNHLEIKHADVSVAVASVYGQ